MKHSGQSLVEYILAAFLVAVVAVAGIVMISGELSAKLPQVLDRIFGVGQAGTGGANDPAQSGAISMAEAPSPNTLSDVGPVEVVTARGTRLTLQNYPADMAKAIETAGGNGTTKLLLASMERLIQELEDSGELDAQQANLLRDLANQGHRIAAIEKLIETADSTSSDFNEFLNASAEFEGQSYKVRILKDQIAIHSDTVYDKVGQLASTKDFSTLDSQDGGPEMNRFIALFKEAEAKGALQDPAVREAIGFLSSDIALIAASVEDTVDKYVENPAGMGEPGQVSQLAASFYTNLDSKDICNTGGGNDSGIHCP